MATSEKEKMISGALYNPLDAQLIEERNKARLLFKQLNDTSDNDSLLRKQILKQLIPNQGEDLWIEPPFYCDYGSNITMGNKVFFNFDCVILDVAPVVIGDFVMCGPKVQIYTATHPLDWQTRCSGVEYAKPITIGSHVWLGGGVIVCPGVTIGNRSVIGAGSVVTKDIPDDVFAAGNPCKVIRKLVD